MDLKFYTVSGGGVDLRINNQNNSSLHILVHNLCYEEEKCRGLKHILIICFLLISSLCLIDTIHILFIIIQICFLFYKIIRVANLVHSESVLAVRTFGIEASIKYFAGRSSNVFIPMDCIHNIVIAELVHRLKIIYLLEVLTEELFYKEKPIVPLFHKLNPSINCLKIIYQSLVEHIAN